jgi:A/G-specific adenine glycosylase
MLQQTSVARVLGRWEGFLERWPDPASCAAEPLVEILRFWVGLGYPRRARALWEAAAMISAAGWPVDEAGLRQLPGVGAYTARALLVLAFGAEGPPPQDVNVSRVAARALLGVELHQVSGRDLDYALDARRVGGLSARDQTLALFDVGATICTARTPRCGACPLRRRCLSAARLQVSPPPPTPRRRPAYAGSLRQLRGAVLTALLRPAPPRTLAELEEHLAGLALAAAPGAVEAAVAGLRADALIPPAPRNDPELLAAT